MLIARLLNGHLMLVVHESAFQGDYLAQVLAAAGAAVMGPVRTGGAAVALIDGGDRPCAMVLSHAVHDHDGRPLADAARRHGIAALIVHPARVPPEPAGANLRCLATPCGGFQVVEAITELLAADRHAETEPVAAAALPH